MAKITIGQLWPFRLFKKVSIRRMNEGDLAEANALVRGLMYLEAPARSKNAENRQYAGFVAEVKEGAGKRIVGFGTANINKNTGIAKLEDLFVDRYYRNRGIAAKLVEATVKHVFEEWKAKEATGHLATWNLERGVPSAFKRFGFEPHKEEGDIVVKRQKYLESEARP